MTEKSALYAFVVGEVDEAFYGRNDLAKFPLGLAKCENFFIDYKGGAYNRPGTELKFIFSTGRERLFRFKSPGSDLILVFAPGKMYVISSTTGTMSLVGSASSATKTGGGALSAPSLGATVGDYIRATKDGVSRNYYVTFALGDSYDLVDEYGEEIEDGTYTVQRYHSVTITQIYAAIMDDLNFYQDGDTVVITYPYFEPLEVKYNSPTSWTVSTISVDRPAAPSIISVVASSGGSAQVAYMVTAVKDGVESLPSTPVVQTGVNMTTTTGHYTVTFTPTPGADYHNIYRTLVYPNATDFTGGQYGYLTRVDAGGTEFKDMNWTPDFTKSVPLELVSMGTDNYPALYTRFQQRGVYAGFAKEPLKVLGANRLSRRNFTTSIPPVDSEGFSLTLDADTMRPIKHMLKLRYGLMLFTDDLIVQLRGTKDSGALTPNTAQAETQAYTSVSDMKPLAVNLDLMFMSKASTSLHVMLYTEYTNSFQMQDILVLSTHLFGKDKGAVEVDWAPEPHRLVHFVREDGGRVTLAYERQQEIFGWSPHTTQGYYRDVIVVSEKTRDAPVYLVDRTLRGVTCRCLEIERARDDQKYLNMWYVDCGVRRAMKQGAMNTTLYKEDTPEGEAQLWKVVMLSSGLSDIAAGDRMYIHGYLFNVKEKISNTQLIIQEMQPNDFEERLKHGPLAVPRTEIAYNSTITSMSGLYHLEGQTVSVQADGDMYVDLVVEDGSVSWTNPAAYVVVGLPYRSRLQTLPLGLSNYVLNGKPINIRGVASHLHNTRGLKMGPSFDDLQEIPAAQFEDWGSPFTGHTGLNLDNFYGMGGWEPQSSICAEQAYPAPAAIIGLTANLDVGDD